MATAQLRSYEAIASSPCWRNPLLLFCKRAMDVVLATLLLVVLSPCILILAALVKLTSPGPIFYRWRVAGKEGREFIGYKFRSMVANADELKSGLIARNEMKGPVFKLTDDPRVTSLGRWLRRYSLDELPQLYSVLKGDMSLVGPRPPLIAEYARFTGFQKQKLIVKPGMTCLWQVNGRNSINDFDDWIRLDLEYIRSWTLWLDLKILFRTAAVVISGSGK